MKKIRPSLVACLALLAAACTAHIDSSAAPQSDEDPGVDGAAGGASKFGSNNAGSAAAKPDAGKPSVPAYDDDDAGAPVAKPDAGYDAGTDAGARTDAGASDAGASSDAGADAGRDAGADAGSTSMPVADAAAACDFKGLVMNRCAGSSCHGGPAAGSGLDLTSAMLPMRVEGRKGPASCSSNLLIDKTNPAKSALYLKVTGSTCGSQMPLGGGTLPKADQDCILSWIEGLP